MNYRCWRTADGNILVESAKDYTIYDAYSKTYSSKAYYLLNPEGEIIYAYEPGTGVAQEDSITTTYYVSDSKLYHCWATETDYHSRTNRFVELEDLQPISDPQSIQVLKKFLDDFEGKVKKYHSDIRDVVMRMERRREESLLKSTEQLPDLPDLKELHVIWDSEPSEENLLTILRIGEKVIWREEAYYGGKRRFEEVKKILKKKYGRRLKSFEVNFGNHTTGIWYYGD